MCQHTCERHETGELDFCGDCGNWIQRNQMKAHLLECHRGIPVKEVDAIIADQYTPHPSPFRAALKQADPT